MDVRNCFTVGFSYYSNIPGVSPLDYDTSAYVRKGESERASGREKEKGGRGE